MSGKLFISLLLCLLTGGCFITGLDVDLYTLDPSNNNNETGAGDPTYISSPILGPEHSDFADGSFIAGELEVTIEVPEAERHIDLTIIYTIDGTEPTKENGEVYINPIPILCDAKDEFTVRSFAFTEELTSSVSSKQYTCNDVQLEQPIITPYQQEYEAGTVVEVAITDTNPVDLKGVKIVYTLDGSAPTTTHGILYEDPFEITGQAGKIIVVRTFVYINDGTPEAPTSAITRQDFAFIAIQ